MCPSVPSGHGKAVSRIPDSISNMRSILFFSGDLARPRPGPADRGTTRQCAELLGVDLATVQELAANVEPYLRVDGTKVWSSCSLSASSGPRRTAGAEAGTSTADEPRPPMHKPSRAPAGRTTLLNFSDQQHISM
jgi:hypothetical protein